MKHIKLLFVTTISSLILISAVSFSNDDKYFQIAKNLDIFATLYKEVNAYYVDEVNPNTLIQKGINAMLNSLDPYTDYISEDNIEDYRTVTTGQYGGIGALVGKRNGVNYIIMPYEGYPAHKAGLNIGDEILAINGITVSDKNTEEISKLLKGQAKSSIELTIKRFNKEEPFKVELKREKITIDNVPYFGMVNSEIGYIKLSDFTTEAGKEVKKAVKELKKTGANKLILDLRGNPGGLLNEAINVSNIFIEKGNEIVSTKGKVTSWNKTYRALDEALDTEIPLAVLINRSSASASEIVGGVVQDYDRGILVGRKTFGKGLVQATRPLSYNSQLKVTTAKYYIPSGRCIQAIDYSNRNPDGSVGKIPDSLKAEFKTENGRIVYDGGGVDPDVEVDARNYAPVSNALVSKNLIFDFATEYFYSHPEEPDSRYFEIDNALYEEFKNWVQTKDFIYSTNVEKSVDELVSAAENEKYYQNIEDEIQVLKKEIQDSKNSDLITFREEITRLLKREIVGRYHLQAGVIEASFLNDLDVMKAIEILNDTATYNDILVSKGSGDG
ncbi:MAG TPA: S41 family peptidase [Cyclobacteriaceae bacterium]